MGKPNVETDPNGAKQADYYDIYKYGQTYDYKSDVSLEGLPGFHQTVYRLLHHRLYTRLDTLQQMLVDAGYTDCKLHNILGATIFLSNHGLVDSVIIARRDDAAKTKVPGIEAITDVLPLELAIMHELYRNSDGMTYEEIMTAVEPLFGGVKRHMIIHAVRNVLYSNKHYIEITKAVSPDVKKGLVVKCSLTQKGIDMHVSWAAASRRAGGTLHLETMKLIAERQRRQGHFCLPDLGDSTRRMPDLVVMEPEIVTVGSKRKYSPFHWNNFTAIAVEIEVDPTKHPDQVYANWQNNNDMGLRVWFIVFNEASHKAVVKIMESHNVQKTDYDITQISIKDVADDTAPKPPLLLSADDLSKSIASAKKKEMGGDIVVMSPVETAVFNALDTQIYLDMDDLNMALTSMGVPLKGKNDIKAAIISLHKRDLVSMHNGLIRKKPTTAMKRRDLLKACGRDATAPPDGGAHDDNT